ncbi:MAG: M15 family metallopeptidase [Chitinophagales bacterium]
MSLLWTGSNHNFGCAVDVKYYGKDSLLDMGTTYDYFGPEAEPRYQWQYLKEGKLTQTQIDNRLLLKNVMKAAGFQAIQTEWWHFNGISKEQETEDYYRIVHEVKSKFIKSKYSIVVFILNFVSFRLNAKQNKEI